MNTGNIFLIGMMGSGKSTVGKLLAEKMQMTFIDLDEIIETNARKSVRELFEQEGESHFRKLESEALVNIKKENSVIACGGGIILDKLNRNKLQSSGKVVYLQVSISKLTKRLQSLNDRPLLEGKEIEKELNRIWDKRKELYEGVAQMTIQVDKQTPEQITKFIIDKLNQ
ncbi:MAG: shikimate kinase [Candidatus Marinimicrobia bacterium]|nr:shikimate kinase [Candidatus Neomarinimicrobiota bacterium]